MDTLFCGGVRHRSRINRSVICRRVDCCCFSIGSVLAAEAVNSAIEALADVISPDYNEAIGRAKDMAAGAVLMLAVAAATIGLIIFIPKLF